jgi:hypothetical protein
MALRKRLQRLEEVVRVTSAVPCPVCDPRPIQIVEYDPDSPEAAQDKEPNESGLCPRCGRPIGDRITKILIVRNGRNVTEEQDEDLEALKLDEGYAHP